MSTGLCTVPTCGQAACASLLSGHFCPSHFIAYSYRWLEECDEQIKKRGQLDGLVSERLLKTLIAIAGGAVTIALEGHDVNGMEQAQILDILASVTSLADNERFGLNRSVT